VISRGLTLASISAWMLLACEARSQSVPQATPNNSSAPQHSASAQEHQDRSFYLGTPVTHPEDLSGVWEAPDGHGGAIGIHLLLDTTAPVDATTLAGARQAWLGLQVGLYRRSGAELQLGDENFFSDSTRGGGVRYEGDRLALHARGYDLDLHRIAQDREDKDKDDQWSGRFHREDIDTVVTLRRPMLEAALKDTAKAKAKGTWFLGTWKSMSGPQVTCLHIAEAIPAAFLAWSDNLSTLGSTSFAPQVATPPYSWEHYGDLVKVQPAENGGLWVELGAYSPICCSYRFHATSADNGKAMKADWPAGPSQSPHKSKWTKVTGGSCIPGAP
jgi:hypothetical protein